MRQTVETENFTHSLFLQLFFFFLESVLKRSDPEPKTRNTSASFSRSRFRPYSFIFIIDLMRSPQRAQVHLRGMETSRVTPDTCLLLDMWAGCCRPAPFIPSAAKKHWFQMMSYSGRKGISAGFKASRAEGASDGDTNRFVEPFLIRSGGSWLFFCRRL